MTKYLSEDVSSEYNNTLTAYNIENSPTTSNTHYRGKFSGAAKKGVKFLREHKGKIAVAAGTGLLIAGGLAALASTRGIGYNIKDMTAISEYAVKELNFNSILHPSEQAIRFSEEVINKPGIVTVSLGNKIIEKFSGRIAEIANIVKPYVSKSTIKDIPYYLGIGEGSSFGTYGVYGAIRKLKEWRDKKR